MEGSFEHGNTFRVLKNVEKLPRNCAAGGFARRGHLNGVSSLELLKIHSVE
jgi:hypothetical protein